MVFPPEQRGLGLALMAVVANTAGAIGPVLGGALVEYASWHWIFAINVPVGIIGVVLALRVMPETFDLTASRSVDVAGMVLIGGSIFCLTYGLVEANSVGWGSTQTVLLLGGAVVLAAGFAISQRLGKSPMLVPALTRNRQFMGASAAAVPVRDRCDGHAVPGGDRVREPVGLLADRGRPGDHADRGAGHGGLAPRGPPRRSHSAARDRRAGPGDDGRGPRLAGAGLHGRAGLPGGARRP